MHWFRRPLSRRSAWLRGLTAGVAGLAGITTLAMIASPAHASTVISPLQVQPANSVALGVYVADPGKAAALTAYAAAVGRQPAIVEWSQSWSEPLFYSSQKTSVKQVGATPLISWDPVVRTGGVPLAAIANGSYDSYLRTSAQAAKAWGGPLFIRFAHEMNLPGSLFGPRRSGNTSAGFVAAWRHVVTVFRQQGATNVSWVWSPNVDCAGQCPFQSFYPGDAYVDWVGLDGYNYSAVDHVPWMTFDQIFAPSYREVTALTAKPLMIAETASAEVGGSKAAWIQQAFAQIPATMPRIRAVVWFDRVKETDWQVDSSPSSLAAFRQVASSPRYTARVTVP